MFFKKRANRFLNLFSVLILVAIVLPASWRPNNSAAAQDLFDDTVTPTVETTPVVEVTPQVEQTPEPVSTPSVGETPVAPITETPPATPPVVELLEQQISSAALKVNFMAPFNWVTQVDFPMFVTGYRNVKAVLLFPPEESDQVVLVSLAKKSQLGLEAWLKQQQVRFPTDLQVVFLENEVFGYPAAAAFGHISAGMNVLYVFVDRGTTVLEISHQSSTGFVFLNQFNRLLVTLNPVNSDVFGENQPLDLAVMFPLSSVMEPSLLTPQFGEELQALAYSNCSGQSSAGSAQDALFFSGVLGRMGIADSQFARDAFMAWKPYENTSACWNPLATTYQTAWFPSGTGCTDTMFNSVGVRNYSSRECGQLATARTLLYSGSGTYYKPIRDMLSQTSFNWQALHGSVKKWVGSEAYATSITNKWQMLWNSRSITRCASIPSGQFCGEYYNNRSLSGSPAFAKNTGNINFDWGYNAPGGTVGSDNFSARWQGIFPFEKAGYIFKVTADDGVRLYVDNVLKYPSVPNQDPWRDQPATTYIYDLGFSAGNHTVKLEYYENGGAAVAQVSWQKKTYASEWVRQSPYLTLTQGSSAEMWVTYKNMGNMTWYNTYSPNRTHLGTLNPTTGAVDYASPFVCSPGWLGKNRPAVLSDPSVVQGSNGTFRFNICVPAALAPGVYRIAVAPLVENVAWMQSQFVYWDVTVKPIPPVGCNVSCQDELNQSLKLTDKQTVLASRLPGTIPVVGMDSIHGKPGQLPLSAPVNSDTGNRFAGLYKAVIAQFGVNTNPRYAPSSGYTYCNTFAGDVARAMGNSLPTKAEYYGNNDRATIGFPALYDWFASSSSNRGWRKVDAYSTDGMKQIIDHVNSGKMAIAVTKYQVKDKDGKPVWVGHIAVIRPGQGNVTNAYDLRIAQAGKTNGVDMTLKTGFGTLKPLFFIHD